MNATLTQKADEGGTVRAAVDAVVSAGAEAISVADAGTKEAFLDGWTRTLVEHAGLLRKTGNQLDAPIVMVYVPTWSKLGKELNWNRQQMLGSRASDPLAGILGVGRLEVGAYVCPNQILNSHDAAQIIDAAGLGEMLTIALMSNKDLYIWPQGINSDTRHYRRTLDDEAGVMDSDLLDRNLTEFYEEVGRQTRKWWLDKEMRITVADAESVVQEALWHFLLGAYAERAKVRQETVSGSGRMDLSIRPIREGDTSAVLELKCTRDYATPKSTTVEPTPRSLKTNIDWAVSGVAQTASYRDHERLHVAFLCVYDFCAGNRKEIEDAIREESELHFVKGRRYWITASNEEHRKDRFPRLSVITQTSESTGN